MVGLALRKKRYGVVIVTYGEVEKLSVATLWPSTRKILEAVTRQIVDLPAPLVRSLADYRSAKHYVDWKLHRYRSRLVPINREQARGVARMLAGSAALAAMPVEVEVVDAYYFVPPYLEACLERFRSEKDGVIIVPMIPVESAFSCGVACQMAMDSYGPDIFSKLRVMHGLWKDRELHRIYLDHLFGNLPDAMRSASTGKRGLVLVIHGTIVRNRKGNPPSVFTGLDETMAFFGMMREAVMGDPRNLFDEVKLGCLNHKRGGEWTPETVERALAGFKDEGYESVAMFPFGYFADNSETDYEAKKMLDASGLPLSHYIPCINNTDAFYRWLALRIEDEIGRLATLQGSFEEGA